MSILPPIVEPPAAVAAIPALPSDAELVRSLPVAIELMRSQRTADVPTGHLDAYIARGWMRWAGGRLIVTVQGQAVRDGANAQDERHG
ncbi:MAG TPA: hypothetical protein VLI72_03055 [Methylibium sp.]|nr:hypothetical protein [Methylibium sp.]